ncbi:hypothetical protein [Flavobacterium capsici]|uniref:Uncharacterized protein n=1 Tax=Flavobacterium capsici TaxID=3075618 RepID=A0AA96F2I2_9FLAO|nr:MULTISPECIES: hypothetical protein [unclassified Flavobacterium]WNM20186.1 hypothetical protein RN608_05775 [Flavobacterium sp. PMR2A8]WNM21576.1 hypothetical protein RN605_12945 [Flavobacterium sp. PMTSA4]
MGLIILPFLLGALGIAVLAMMEILKLIKSKKITIKEIIIGFGLTLLIFAAIVISYLIEGKAWVLSPAFRIPVIMVYIPFFIYSLVKTSDNQKLKYFSILILISISITGILGIVFNDVFFELINYLGIEKNY